MPHTEWTSPRKMMDYYMDQSDVIEACEKRLYLAVINGEVRARLKGRVLGPEWLKQIAAMKYDDPFTLPYRLNQDWIDYRFRMPRSFGRFNAAMSLRRQSLEQLRCLQVPRNGSIRPRVTTSSNLKELGGPLYNREEPISTKFADNTPKPDVVAGNGRKYDVNVGSCCTVPTYLGVVSVGSLIFQ